jgi:CheY-like chemotaxis protein
MTYRILVVDDSKLARMAVGKTLKAVRPDWTPVEAANADDALALARSDAFDLAIIDFNMPGRDGLQLAADMLGQRPGMPLAVISANTQTEVVTRAREVGATFLEKPLTEKALAEFAADATKRLSAVAR